MKPVFVCFVLSGVVMACAQTPQLDRFERRQLQFERRDAIGGGGGLRGPGQFAPVTKSVLGRLVGIEKIKGGSKLAFDNDGQTYQLKAFSYGSFQYDKTKNETTITDFVPFSEPEKAGRARAGIVSFNHVLAQSANSNAIGLGYLVQPHGDDTGTKDGIGSYLVSASYRKKEFSGGTSATTWKGHGEFQFNSDNDIAQISGYADVSSTTGGNRLFTPSISISSGALLPGSTIGLTLAYEDIKGSTNSRGETAQINFEHDLTSWSTLYSDYTFPSRVEGPFGWDLGVKLKLIPNVKFFAEIDPGSVFLFGLSHKFTIRSGP